MTFVFTAAWIAVVLAGPIKYFAAIAVPGGIDANVVLGASIVLATGWRAASRGLLAPRHWRSKRLNAAFIAATVGVAGYAWISLLWTPSVVGAREKALALMVPATAVATLALAGPISARQAMRAFVVTCGVLLAVYVAVYPSVLANKHWRADFGTAGYALVGMPLGGAVVVLATWPGLFRVRLQRMLLVSLSAGLVTTGARGPLLIAIGVVMLVWASRRMRSGGQVMLTIAVACLCGAVLTVAMGALDDVMQDMAARYRGGAGSLLDRSVGRASLLLEDGGGRSMLGRSEHLEFVVASRGSLRDVALGRGLGSYGLYRYGEDVMTHPHSAPLEVWFELGVIGIASVLWWSAVAVRGAARTPVLWPLLAYCALNALKSSSFSESRVLVAMAALASLWQSDAGTTRSISHE